MAETNQIPLDFGHSPDYAAEDFIVSPSNAEAFGWMNRWPDWPSFGLGLWGPAGSGKTHLAHLFTERHGGVILPARQLTVDIVPALSQTAGVIIEDADQGGNEAALFHLFNHLKENSRFFVATGQDAPSRWTIALPDLKSRLTALPVASIKAPDDELLQILLPKLFSDRQLRIAPDVVSYILPRMERSFEAARALVAALDAAAMARQKAVSIPLVRDVMSNMTDIDHPLSQERR